MKFDNKIFRHLWISLYSVCDQLYMAEERFCETKPCSRLTLEREMKKSIINKRATANGYKDGKYEKTARARTRSWMVLSSCVYVCVSCGFWLAATAKLIMMMFYAGHEITEA